MGAGVGKNITYRVQGSLGNQRGKCTVKMRELPYLTDHNKANKFA